MYRLLALHDLLWGRLHGSLVDMMGHMLTVACCRLLMRVCLPNSLVLGGTIVARWWPIGGLLRTVVLARAAIVILWCVVRLVLRCRWTESRL